MIGALRNNFGLKALAFGLALAAWAYFHLAASPTAIARFDQTLSVPIVATGLRPGFQVRYADKVATVVVQEPRNGAAVTSSSVQAAIDVSDLVDPGLHTVPVKIVAPDVAISSLAPASVVVSLDRIEDRVVPVSLDYTGVRGGVVVDTAAVTPSTATIRGVASDLAKVSTVRVSIPIPAKPQRLDAMIRPMPVDARGAEIPGVGLSPNLLRVRATFVNASGQPAATPPAK